jgi:hypothetical protein
LQAWAGIDTQFLGQPHPQLLEVFQGLSLTAALVQREHQLAGHALIQRVRPSPSEQLAQQPSVLTTAQLQVGAVQLDSEPVPLQWTPQRADPRSVQADERLPPPQPQGLLEQHQRPILIISRAGLGDQMMEPVHIHHHRIESEDITPRLAHEIDLADRAQGLA